MQAVAVDNSLPIDRVAVDLWLRDIQNPLRWIVRPVLQFVFAMLLHVTWALKRLPLPQFRAHRLLQRTICWFCRNFVSPEANLLILRHFATESNLLNFLRDNSAPPALPPLELYPRKIDDLLRYTFVQPRPGAVPHDARARALGRSRRAPQAPASSIGRTGGRSNSIDQGHPRRCDQMLDFETSHALFMCLFCLLLTAEEYRDSINGFNLDQSIAIRIGQIIGDPRSPSSPTTSTRSIWSARGISRSGF